MVIGLTGKYASGKSSVALILEEKGFLHIDVDKLGHIALKEKRDEIEKAFGSSVIDVDGVDRTALGRIVFNNKEKKALLEGIVHPVMVEEIRKIIEANKDKNIVINAAILAQMGLLPYCNSVIWVNAPFLKRLNRALYRDKRGIFAVLSRMKAQKNLKPNLTKKYVDTYIINNKETSVELSANVDKILETIYSRK